MPIWSAEIKEIQSLFNLFRGQYPDLEKELKPLIASEDPNVVLLYSRRCLEVIVTELCEIELKRPRKTEPLKGIIDKLNSEEKVPFNIITSMQSLNSLSTFGTHPKDFEEEQVKPVLNNLATIIKWYLKYKESPNKEISQNEAKSVLSRTSMQLKKRTWNRPFKILSYFIALFLVLATVFVAIKFDVFGKKDEKSIAVLPFRNDSPDTTNIYFINGVMEDILNNLQKIKDLRVISRTSVEQYRNLTKSIPEIAKELGVNYIVEGSGQRSGNKIHLSVQLLRAAKEGHLWGNSFERELHSATEIFDMQRQISETIASELKAVITPQEKRLIEKRPTGNLEAYEAYLKGQFYLTRFTPEALDSAMRYFELAKENDPEYALAYSGICDVWAYRQQWGLVTPSEGNPKAMEAVMKAYELDSSNAVVLSSLAGKKTWGMFDWSGGESGFKKSLALNPNNAMTRAMYSHLLNILGRPEEALEQVRTARKLDPMNPFIITFSAIDFMMARKYDEAIKEFNEALRIEPGYPFALTNLWQALYLSGKTEEAYATYKTFWGMVDPESQKPIEQGYLRDGINGACLSLADRLEKLWTISQNQFFAPFDIAILYSIGKDVDKSIYWLEQSYKFRDPNVPYLLFPAFEYVRNDPRFKNLCQIMKLPWKVKT